MPVSHSGHIGLHNIYYDNHKSCSYWTWIISHNEEYRGSTYSLLASLYSTASRIGKLISFTCSAAVP